MSVVELDKLTWPQVRDEIAAGRDTVVVAFGATEQHGTHMPLATDALLGDHFARLLADRLDAFVAPTVRVGCSSHHLGFPGTLSISDETFHAIVADLVQSLAVGGFRRAVLIPTHGGNFAPLAAAVEKLPEPAGIEVTALTDLGVLLQVAVLGEQEHGVPLSEGGIHAGEWETSLMLAVAPQLVHMDSAEAGYTGDLQAGLEAMLADGMKAVSDNGAFGDPARASAEHGARYWQAAVDLAMEQLESS